MEKIPIENDLNISRISIIEDNMVNQKIIIELKHITKKFGGFTAVNDVSLEIFQGEVLGFLGPNGAGKSTTMKMVANLLNPTSGEVWVRHNNKLQKLSKHNQDILLSNIGFLIENPSFYTNVTPRQVLTLFAKLKGYPRNKIHDRVEKVVQMVEMIQWIDEKIGTFSKGMRQKIGVVSAIVHDPDIIILDEPHTGLDPKARIEVRDFILKLKELKKTVFLSSHLLYEISEVADRVAIISNGVLVACDTLENLEAQTKRSIIEMEILDQNDHDEVISNLDNIIGEYLNNPIFYKKDVKIYELPFDATPEKQYKILQTLIENGIKVIEFSVPKAGLLEALYLKYISTSDKTYKKFQKKLIKVDSVF